MKLLFKNRANVKKKSLEHEHVHVHVCVCGQERDLVR